MVLLLVCYVTLFVFSLPGTFHSWRQMLPLRGHILSQFVTVDAMFVDNISKFVEDPGSCGDEGGVSTLRDGGVLSGLSPDLQ